MKTIRIEFEASDRIAQRTMTDFKMLHPQYALMQLFRQFLWWGYAYTHNPRLQVLDYDKKVTS